MCGIAGLMSVDGAAPSRVLLQRLGEALVHRGPDGVGYHTAGSVGLVQRRLAIIDLATGGQPLYAPDGAALVANGEIYNYIELRPQLPGVRFVSDSDCEPPLHLYRRDGIEFTRHLRGMYAIAIHDPAGRLILARDPFGIKPLYYVETEELFAFASEPEALIRAGLLGVELVRQVRNQLLQLQFTTGRDTIYAGIRRVLPGETLVVSGGRVVERYQRDALPFGGPRPLELPEALAQLDATLTESVRLHQRSDVPYGMFLSGGIDSAAVLALMAELNERPVMAFTVGFPGSQAADERPLARAVAQSFGARHVEVEFREAEFWHLLPAVAAALDDPVADYAVLPTFLLGRAAREAGLKVILSGEGGDELFAGYGRYRRVTRSRWLGGREMRLAGNLDGLGILRGRMAGWRDGIEEAKRLATIEGRTTIQIAQATDCADWLPNDLLTKLDRCLMAHGVEGRTPFLDPAVAAFAYRLPDALKVKDGLGKWLLRKWLEGRAPAAQAFARKQGFTVPVGDWIAKRGAMLGPLVARQPGIREVCLPGAVEALFAAAPDKRAAFAAWTLLFYALWHRSHILRQPVERDVFVALSGVA